jgi:hypothetical protein
MQNKANQGRCHRNGGFLPMTQEIAAALRAS